MSGSVAFLVVGQPSKDLKVSVQGGLDGRTSNLYEFANALYAIFVCEVNCEFCDTAMDDWFGDHLEFEELSDEDDITGHDEFLFLLSGGDIAEEFGVAGGFGFFSEDLVKSVGILEFGLALVKEVSPKVYVKVPKNDTQFGVYFAKVWFHDCLIEDACNYILKNVRSILNSEEFLA